MHKLLKATCAIHDLSLATAFGGPLFAHAAHRAVLRDVKDEKERGRILATAWSKFNRLDVPAHVLFTATWLIQRRAIKMVHLDAKTKKLVRTKDLLITGALLTGLANIAVGRRIKREYPEGVPVSTRVTTDARLAAYQRYYRVMGPAHLLLLGASIAIGPAIGFGVVRSIRRNILARLLEK